MSTTPDTDSDRLSAESWEDYWRGIGLPRLPRLLNPNARFLARMLDRALAETGVPPEEAAVFEIGCAPGAWLAWLAKERGCTVGGCDYATQALRATRKNFELLGVEGALHETDVRRLHGERQGRHDLVFSLGLVEHFTDTAAIVEAHARVCRPGGIVLVQVPHLRGLAGRPFHWADPNVMESHEDITPERLAQGARAAGLDPLMCECAGPLSAFVLLDRLKSPAARWPVYGAAMAAGYLTWPLAVATLSGSVVLLARKPGGSAQETTA